MNEVEDRWVLDMVYCRLLVCFPGSDVIGICRMGK